MYIGSEHLRVRGQDTAVTVEDFWRWSFSDLYDRSIRAAFSKFLIASSLGILSDRNGRQRVPDGDLLWTPCGGPGLRIGPRASAYIQSGEGDRPDRISFPLPYRTHCDVCVFCVFKAMSQQEGSPLDTDLWDFYTLRSSRLGEKRPRQGSITLPVLTGMGPVWSDWYGIGDAIREEMEAR